MEGRRVILFQRRPGADRKLASARTQFRPLSARGEWGVHLDHGVNSRHVYGKVLRKVRDRYVCRAGCHPGG
jgi:hypothetical protein